MGEARGLPLLRQGGCIERGQRWQLREHRHPAQLAQRAGIVGVGRAVASVANLLDLQLAVVAGSVALGFGDDFFGAAQETIDELCQIQHARGTVIRPAALGDRAPLIGAAAVGWRGVGRDIL